MKIAMLTQFFPPETLAGANRVAAMVEALAECAEVQVAAPAPSYPDPNAYLGAPPPAVAAGVRLTHVSAFSRQRASWARRAVSELRMASSIARAGTKAPVDVVIASSPSMFLGPLGLLAARRRRARFVWDIRDLTWEYGADPNVMPGRLARAALAILARLMWWTARRADLVVCATAGLGQTVAARLPQQRVEVIPNGLDASLAAALDSLPRERASQLRVLYAGLIGHAQGLEVLLDVAERSPKVEFTIAGDGPRRSELESDATRRRLTNVVFTGYVRPEILVGLYRTADVLFAQLSQSDLHTATASPSKLLEYMAAGRPLVYAGDGAAAELVIQAGAGITVPPGDVDGIVAVLASLTDEQRVRLGRAARRFAEASPTRVDYMRQLATLVSSPL
jgi:colanic acid biosynthesis glycosyl transferase WcaI